MSQALSSGIERIDGFLISGSATSSSQATTGSSGNSLGLILALGILSNFYVNLVLMAVIVVVIKIYKKKEDYPS